MRHLRSMSPRGQPECLILSKLSLNPSPYSMINIRSIPAFYSRPSSDDHICRTPLPLRAGSKYSAHASLGWRSFSNNPQVMRRKRNFGKDYQCTQVVSVQTRCSNPPSKLEDIEVQLRSLREESALLRLVDNVQDGEDVNGLLDDLQEALNDYMVRSRP